MAIPRSEYEQRKDAEKQAILDKMQAEHNEKHARAMSDNAARAAHDRVVRPWAHWR